MEKHIFASICFFELKIIFIFLKIYLRKERLINQHCSGIIYSTNYQKIIKIQIYRIIIKKTKLIQHILSTPHKKINLFTSTTEEEESLVFNGKESWEFGTSSGSLECITSVRDSLRARHGLGVPVSLSYFTCPLALPIWS